MNPRQVQEELEKQHLCEYAMLSVNSRGRAEPEDRCEIRADFTRDRDRIIHCKAFRRLKQKTQVFLSPEGDHFRTRLTHTLEVSQIARTISRALRLNEDLTEAIAMGHDLGHTPFGHEGERVLDKLCSTGFKHYIQSVRVVERLEKNHRGLNLTWETIDGILHHTKGEQPSTLEGQVVRHSDRIAYLNHDIEDAISAGVLSEGEIPSSVLSVLGHRKSERLTTLISDIIKDFDGTLFFSPDVQAAYDELHQFMFDRVYLNSEGAAKLEEHKVEYLICSLFEHYMKYPQSMPPFFISVADEEGTERAVIDYISGMSDAYATYCFRELFIPKAWSL